MMVFKILEGENGKINRYKARLCAKSFMQKHGLDYTETIAPVIRYDSLRIFLALVAYKDLELVQFDVRTVFLYGNLSENIYMKPPERDINLDSNKVVCKLKKSIYGLKQSARCWSDHFREFFRTFDFQESVADKCIFRDSNNGENVYLALYVDDGVIAARSKKAIDEVTNNLKEHFELTVERNVKTFVGMNIERDRANKRLFVHQQTYTKRIIERFDIENAKTVNIPSDPHVTLNPASENSEVLNVKYNRSGRLPHVSSNNIASGYSICSIKGQ